MLKIAYSPIYKYDLPAGHRFPMDKYELLPQQLLHEGTITEDNFFHPEPITDEQILLTHTPAYVHKLNNNLLNRKEQRAIGFPVRPELISRGKHIANGTLQCASYAMQYGVAMNIAGGTHHAYADRGEGFCIFNDFAITANVLLTEGRVKQILIVDLDVHQGNGNAKIFENDPRVFTFSMHGAKNYPLRKEKSDLDIGVNDGIKDADYLALLKAHLPRLINQVKPDLMLYLAGVDIINTDKLGRLGVTRAGCMERDHFVFEQAMAKSIPVAVSMGGGYSVQIKDIIEAHANTFRVAQSLYF
ncbi:histone deacetylase [Bacteroidia bacterium]|nr:histone deacetylase [Bacteroidia bacterium]